MRNSLLKRILCKDPHAYCSNCYRDDEAGVVEDASGSAPLEAQPSYRAKSAASETPDEVEDEDMESFDWGKRGVVTPTM